MDDATCYCPEHVECKGHAQTIECFACGEIAWSASEHACEACGACECTACGSTRKKPGPCHYCAVPAVEVAAAARSLAEMADAAVSSSQKFGRAEPEIAAYWSSYAQGMLAVVARALVPDVAFRSSFVSMLRGEEDSAVWCFNHADRCTDRTIAESQRGRAHGLLMAARVMAEATHTLHYMPRLQWLRAWDHERLRILARQYLDRDLSQVA